MLSGLLPAAKGHIQNLGSIPKRGYRFPAFWGFLSGMWQAPPAAQQYPARAEQIWQVNIFRSVKGAGAHFVMLQQALQPAFTASGSTRIKRAVLSISLSAGRQVWPLLALWRKAYKSPAAMRRSLPCPTCSWAAIPSTWLNFRFSGSRTACRGSFSVLLPWRGQTRGRL